MINIIPEDDLKEHIESSLCDCNPIVEFESGEMIIIHNSYDGREWMEDLSTEQLELLNSTSQNLDDVICETTQLFILAFNKGQLNMEDLLEMLKLAEIEEEFEVAISLRDAINVIRNKTV